MTSLLALLSLMSTAFAGSGDDPTQVSSDNTVNEDSADDVAPAQSIAPEWVSVLDVLATEPLDETMPEMAEADDTEELFLL